MYELGGAKQAGSTYAHGGPAGKRGRSLVTPRGAQKYAGPATPWILTPADLQLGANAPRDRPNRPSPLVGI